MTKPKHSLAVVPVADQPTKVYPLSVHKLKKRSSGIIINDGPITIDTVPKPERTAKPDKSTITLVNIIANKHGQAQNPDIGEAR